MYWKPKRTFVKIFLKSFQLSGWFEIITPFQSMFGILLIWLSTFLLLVLSIYNIIFLLLCIILKVTTSLVL